MNINIRQGIIIPRSRNEYLRRIGSNVDLVVDVSFIRVAFAHGPVNYLLDETATVANAWVGPFTASGSYWFYWDIDTQTGKHSYGTTLVEPDFGSTLPVSPEVDAHFFDTSDNYMKVWDGFNWIQRIRVFAGSLITGTLRASGNGSQANINGTFVGGAIRFAKNNSPVIVELDDENYFFVTVSGDTIQDVGQIENFTFGQLDVSAVAAVDIGKNIAVVYNDSGEIIPASYTLVDREVIGITSSAMLAGERRTIITQGFVEDKQNFSFDASQLHNLFIDVDGNLTTDVPPTSSIQKVGYVAGVNLVYIKPQTQISILDATSTSTLRELYRDRSTSEDLITEGIVTSMCGYTYEQPVASDTWLVIHNNNSIIFGVQVYVNNILVEPDEITILSDNSFRIKFSQPVAGVANFLVFKQGDSCGVIPTPTPSPTISVTPTPTATG